MALTSKERIHRQALGLEVDRIPAIGGWINGAWQLAALADISLDEYLRDPLRGVVRANMALGADAMVQPAVPMTAEAMRSTSVLEENYVGVEPEALETYANSLPDDEAGVLADFDQEAERKQFCDYFDWAASWEGMVAIPNFWDLGGNFPLYHQFGYVAFLSACMLYPEAVGKIWWSRSLRSRERAKILRELYVEYDLPPLLFCGEDLCTNRGPMVSPEFLREHYFPTVKMSLAPLVEAGVRVIHHCDGDVRPLLDDFIQAGSSGFQGFQYEDQVDIYQLRKLRSLLGETPLFFTGLSVTRTLPFGTPQDVHDEVDYFLDATDGGQGMFLFCSNVIGVEVPVENIRAAYQYLRTWNPRQTRTITHKQWPWLVSHPE